MSTPIRVLIVDDSLMMRNHVSKILNEHPNIQVVGVAMDGDFALMKIERLHPDVIILDINMPRMDGLTALKVIHEKYKIPTIMLSAFTKEGAFTTLQALKYGAFDFVCKPEETNSIENRAYLKRKLTEKIKLAFLVKTKQSTGNLDLGDTRRLEEKKLFQTKRLPKREEEEKGVTEHSLTFLELEEKELKENYIPETIPEGLANLVVIGASTGGTLAVEKIIKALPADFPVGIVIAQHMPKNFTAAFAETLNQNTSLRVIEARDRQQILPGEVYITPGDVHIRVKRANTQYIITLDRVTPPVNGLRPCVDILFYSAAIASRQKAIGVILTGMGKDGALGLRAIKEAKGRTVAQDEKTCVVFGMPKEAIKKKAVDDVLPLQDIAQWLIMQVK